MSGTMKKLCKAWVMIAFVALAASPADAAAQANDPGRNSDSPSVNGNNADAVSATTFGTTMLRLREPGAPVTSVFRTNDYEVTVVQSTLGQTLDSGSRFAISITSGGPVSVREVLARLLGQRYLSTLVRYGTFTQEQLNVQLQVPGNSSSENEGRDPPAQRNR